MNRKPRPSTRSNNPPALFSDWRQQLITRRRFLLAAAGGSLAVLFPLSSMTAAENNKEVDSWRVIDVVQQHLFPAESDAPGAGEINALAYLQFVVTDTTLDIENREFISKGAVWLEDMSFQMTKKSFTTLDEKQREKVLQRIASSQSGENWLATLMLYIAEALLTDPVYGGNTDQLGWQWLQHVPGYPRPPLDKTFLRLLA